MIKFQINNSWSTSSKSMRNNSKSKY